MSWKRISGGSGSGGNANVNLNEITKYNVSAGTVISFETEGFNTLPIQVYLLEQGEQDITNTFSDFTSSDANKFSNYGMGDVVFDGHVYQKTLLPRQDEFYGQIGNGVLFYNTCPTLNVKKIEGVVIV